MSTVSLPEGAVNRIESIEEERHRTWTLASERNLPLIPLCWPAAAGQCGCGRGHPLKDVGKAPLVGYKRFVETPPSAAEMKSWFERWPVANIGLLLEPTGLVVIDCDSDAAYAEAQSWGFSPTVEVIRRPDHRHIYGRRPVGGPVGRVVHKGTSRRIDVLSAGYVVLPPSRHRSGALYEWATPPGGEPIHPAPDWALCLIRQSGTRALPTVASASDLPPVDLATLNIDADTRALILDGHAHAPERYQSRSEAVFAVERRLVRGGFDDTTILAVLLDPRFRISDKPLERGREWVTADLARARAFEDRTFPDVYPHPSRTHTAFGRMPARWPRVTIEIEVG